MTTGPRGEIESTASYQTVSPTQPGDSTQFVYVREQRNWGRRLLIFVGSIGALVAAVFALSSFDLLPNIPNPFEKQTTDRSGPVLLTSITDMKRFTGAEGNFEVLVDVQENNKYIWDILVNDHILFVARGTVDAYVDLEKLTAEDIKVSADGKAVELTLPEPVLGKAVLDTKNSYVAKHDQGLFNRVGGFFTDNSPDTQRILSLSTDRIAEAAKNSELIKRAKENTEKMFD